MEPRSGSELHALGCDVALAALTAVRAATVSSALARQLQSRDRKKAVAALGVQPLGANPLWTAPAAIAP